MHSLFFLFLVLHLHTAHALWPAPRAQQTGTTKLRLARNFRITPAFRNAPPDLTQAIQRTTQQLTSDQLAPLVPDRGQSLVAGVKGSATRELASLSLMLLANNTAGGGGRTQLRPIAEEAVRPFAWRDESYFLNVPQTGGTAQLWANTTLGLFRGMTTFTQLWYTVNATVYTPLAPVQIQDTPAFPYRGFMLDTARNYYPIADIKRTLDAMSWVKLNTLHWHIVDSQSFPLQVPGFLELAQKGAYNPQAVYTPAAIKDIVTYANTRGIDVLIEIDTPGHTAVIANSHPEHVACANAKPWADFANEPPAGQLRLANARTVNFTASLLTAVSKMFSSFYFSTGGDEINAACYKNDSATQQSLAAGRKTLEQALDGFTNATHTALRAQKKTPVVWEEMVLGFNLTSIANDTIVMVWISSDNVKAVAQKNRRIVHAASDYFYLDCGGGGWVGNNINGNSWCDPFKTWQKSYSFNPFANLTSAAQRRLVLGGQHLLWSEQSSPSNLDPITWPRAATGAEIYWTGATLPSGRARNVSEALPRLHDLAFRLRARKVGAIALQPEWCALRPGRCDLTA